MFVSCALFHPLWIISVFFTCSTHRFSDSSYSRVTSLGIFYEAKVDQFVMKIWFAQLSIYLEPFFPDLLTTLLLAFSQLIRFGSLNRVRCSSSCRPWNSWLWGEAFRYWALIWIELALRLTCLSSSFRMTDAEKSVLIVILRISALDASSKKSKKLILIYLLHLDKWKRFMRKRIVEISITRLLEILCENG